MPQATPAAARIPASCPAPETSSGASGAASRSPASAGATLATGPVRDDGERDLDASGVLCRRVADPRRTDRVELVEAVEDPLHTGILATSGDRPRTRRFATGRRGSSGASRYR